MCPKAWYLTRTHFYSYSSEVVWFVSLVDFLCGERQKKKGGYVEHFLLLGKNFHLLTRQGNNYVSSYTKWTNCFVIYQRHSYAANCLLKPFLTDHGELYKRITREKKSATNGNSILFLSHDAKILRYCIECTAHLHTYVLYCTYNILLETPRLFLFIFLAMYILRIWSCI